MCAKLLMIPGPIQFDHEVVRALSKMTCSHVDPEFREIFGDTLRGFRQIFRSEGQPFVIAGSGTLAMEMAATNVIQRGEKALVVNNGVFGDRFVSIFKVIIYQFRPFNSAYPFFITLRQCAAG